MSAIEPRSDIVLSCRVLHNFVIGLLQQSFLGGFGKLGASRGFSGIGVFGIPPGATSNVEVLEDACSEGEAGGVFVNTVKEILVSLERYNAGPSSFLRCMVEWVILALQN